ncbi:response regulator [Rhodomicrobium sp. Az07]|uniref:cell cycle two-component system response regulator CpdR n=1 Tax=Rhodomicrobium sp. Az07 TaxID=2839034 RepID=UPI001BE66D83|nr:response regulator [Rhodomicrobium sp. Az07]MBT3070831.1 response regulator [Rhodomicrobium sp. Az07]
MFTILLAEDDDSMRRFLSKALERAGYEVISYDNGADALEGLKENRVTLLLTDIVMPEMDGIELAKRGAELDPDMKIMFITGFAAVALQHYQEAPEKARILSKPIHLKDLVREVDRMLAA